MELNGATKTLNHMETEEIEAPTPEQQEAELTTESETQEDFNDALAADLSENGDENFCVFAHECKRRVRKGWDIVLGWTGEEGVGKSTGAAQFGKAVDDKFSFARNVICNPDKDNVRKLITTLPPYAYVNADEAIKFLYKLRWHDEIQQMVNMIYALCRREYKISSLLMPRFSDFNEFFRNHRIKSWLHVVDRGIIVVFSKHWSPFATDSWLMKENTIRAEKATKRYGINLTRSQKMKILVGSPNYLTTLKFGPLSKEEEEEFDAQRKAAGVYDDETLSLSRVERKQRDQLVLLLEHLSRNKIMSYPTMAEIMGTSANALSHLVCQYEDRDAKAPALRPPPIL